ncbi:MAG: DUF1697 domain-containing protein [Bryobacteraceae bacterium]|nr:DUF1697 domain-containing protein [Bryobacteraceae bacterium]
METLVALLRGVNVVGRNKVPMQTLREICESLKFGDPRTYLQSGNVVFRTRRQPAAAAAALEDEIQARLGFRPAVIARTAAQIAAAADGLPGRFSGDLDRSKLLVMFLAGRPAPDALAKIARLGLPEQVEARDSQVYIYFPDGVGRSKLSTAVLERAFGGPMTGRNWNTVLALRELACGEG